MTHNTHDTVATRLRKAGAARDASDKGQLSNPGTHARSYALQRCTVFQNTQGQAKCVRRV